MAKISWIVLSSVFLFALSAQAQFLSEEECGDVDFSRKMGPVRQQGHTGWCHAFVSADLIGYRMNRDEKTWVNQVSAADVAMQALLTDSRTLIRQANRPKWGRHKEFLKEATQELAYWRVRNIEDDTLAFERGHLVPLVIAAYNFSDGACLEADLPSQSFDDRVEKTVPNLFETTLKKLKLDRWVPSPATLPSVDEIAITEDLALLPRKSSMAKPSPSIEATLAPEIKQPHPSTTEMAQVRVAQELRRSCRRHRLPKLRPVTTSRPPLYEDLLPDDLFEPPNPVLYNTSDDLFGPMNQQISEKNPVGIQFDISMLVPDQEGLHVATVVGRRWNPNMARCEFKVRNSYGRDCGLYSSDLDCRDGQIWVPDMTLIDRVRETTWLK